MNGAESLIRTAVSAGVEVCFANPGTSEMPLVAALDSVAGMRPVLGLFEGVLSGAADGYGRMAEKPAMTLFHLGPGFGNGIANFHNARRARSPIVNLIGDQATWHRRYDAPLTSDIESLARPVSGWFRENRSAETLSHDVAEAIAAATTKPGCVATLTVPTDCQWDPVGDAASPQLVPKAPTVTIEAVEKACAAVTSEGTTMLIAGGYATRRRGLEAIGRIAAQVGCRLAVETFSTRLERGPGLPTLERVPYFPEAAEAFFEGVSHVVLCGALDPVAFFGYPSRISRLVPDTLPCTTLAKPTDNIEQALEDLAAALDAPASVGTPNRPAPQLPTGDLSLDAVGQAIAALQPEGAIVVDEGITSVGRYLPASVGCPDHSLLSLTGGAIGWGLPCATGAAIACPDRKVIALEGDGSGMYTVQSLWTQARENLDVVNLVFANDIYRILQIELHRAGVDNPGPNSLALTDLSEPAIDWTSLSKSLGVPAARVETADQLVEELGKGIAEPGPCLIEVRMP